MRAPHVGELSLGVFLTGLILYLSHALWLASLLGVFSAVIILKESLEAGSRGGGKEEN